MTWYRFGWLILGGLVPSAPLGCTRQDESERTTFYDRKIAPILEGSCATSPSQSSCHVMVDPRRGNALGNLSVESYEALTQRRDLFVDYGPYGVPALLLKVLPPFEIRLTSWDGSEPRIITTNIAHVGGSLLDVTSSSFTQLEQWLANGAAENNAPPLPAEYAFTECSDSPGSDPLFDPDTEPGTPDYAEFDRVNQVIGQRCAAGNCHGSPSNSLYFTCGDSTVSRRWNYFVASDYVSTATETSEILRRVLDPAEGGTFHEGGVIFTSNDDPDYQALATWATTKGGPTNVPTDLGFQFFERRVQPMLVKRGCMMLGCHSAAMFHDYRLRGGSAGHFALPATRTNYDLTLDQVALESPDPNASRLIRKNLPPGPAGLGILHRGGPLFGDGGDPSACDLDAAQNGPLDEQDPYCVLVAWIGIERNARMAAAAPLSGIVFVRRPPSAVSDTPQDYGRYSPGAEVVRVAATLAADGSITLGTETSLSALCGLDLSVSDARRPAVSWDAARIAFSARSSEAAPYRVYVVEGDSCTVEATIDAAPVDDAGEPVPANNELVHNFDPAFAPDGRIVFASTRGNVMNASAFSYSGPQRAPADPSKLNANLYVLESGAVRQLTFLLNQELTPAFMSDGRVIFVAEKRAPGFYQLAGRRINLDGGDYHPLFGQRSSIGHEQFTDVVELADKNLAAIVSERGAARSAGALIVVNRSIGIDQHSEDPEDYPVDPAAIDYPNPRFYQRAIRFADLQASGLLGGTQGAYRSPSPLPDGKLLVSFAPGVTNLASFGDSFELWIVDPVALERSVLMTSTQDILWPVAVYARQDHGVFVSRRDEPNGSTEVFTDERRAESHVTFIDVPLLMSLVFQNTRSGRTLSDPEFSVWESLPPVAGVTSLDSSDPFVIEDQFGLVYARRQLLGSPDIYRDGSAAIRLRGGIPVMYSTRIQLSGDAAPEQHFVREEFQFYPGEVANQSFSRDLFNGLCAGCHGSVSGLESEIAVNPDILTRASDVVASQPDPDDLRRAEGDPEPQPFE
ncbi:MAG TPA: hypothetical protein VF989_13315 [Polyangiaceae bacterium]